MERSVKSISVKRMSLSMCQDYRLNGQKRQQEALKHDSQTAFNLAMHGYLIAVYKS